MREPRSGPRAPGPSRASALTLSLGGAAIALLLLLATLSEKWLNPRSDVLLFADDARAVADRGGLWCGRLAPPLSPAPFGPATAENLRSRPPNVGVCP